MNDLTALIAVVAQRDRMSRYVDDTVTFERRPDTRVRRPSGRRLRP